MKKKKIALKNGEKGLIMHLFNLILSSKWGGGMIEMHNIYPWDNLLTLPLRSSCLRCARAEWSVGVHRRGNIPHQGGQKSRTQKGKIVVRDADPVCWCTPAREHSTSRRTKKQNPKRQKSQSGMRIRSDLWIVGHPDPLLL